MIEINQEICIGCGRCLEVCPSRILQRREDGKVENPGKKCMQCMHCGAMCPTGAVTVDGESTVKERIQHPVCMEDLERIEDALYQRRSYRIFKDQEVPEALIRRALDAAMWGASAKNDHPTRWIVLKDAGLRDEMMEKIMVYLKENHLSPEVVSAVESGYNPVVGHNSTMIIGYCGAGAINPSQDTAIAITNAELVLQAAGVGTCWGGYLCRFINGIPGIKEMLHIPAECEVYGTIMIGYPDQHPYVSVPDRRTKAEIVFL